MAEVVEKQVVSRLRELLVMLPYDLKVLFEVMTDEDLPKDARYLAAGGVMYCLSPADAMPDLLGPVGFVDDAIAVRLVLKRLLDTGGEDFSEYPERFPEQFAGLDADLELFDSYFAESLGWLSERLELKRLSAMKHKGKTVVEYVEDDELGQRLYEDGLEFATDYELDDDAVTKLTSATIIRDAFDRRRHAEQRRS